VELIVIKKIKILSKEKKWSSASSFGDTGIIASQNFLGTLRNKINCNVYIGGEHLSLPQKSKRLYYY